MPYIITTRYDDAIHPQASTPEHPNPRAVATLGDVQAYVSGLAGALLDWPSNVEASRRAANQLWHLPESGGTVGPLPDGTVIEVEHVQWIDPMWSESLRPDVYVSNRAAAIDAYNEAQ